MDLLKKLSGKQEVIEPGEELLHSAYQFKNLPGRQVTALIGVDGGSTQTRGVVLDLEDLSKFEESLEKSLGEVFTIPSLSVTIPDDRNIQAKSDNLYDDLESQIVNLHSNEEVIFRSARLVRGTKAFNSELNENRLGSSTQKTEDVTYYYNLLDLIGYSMLLKYRDKVPEVVKVYLACALPPDDINPVNIEKRLKPNLKTYRWVHKSSGVSIQIDFAGVEVMTEPEAFVKAFYAMSDQETPDYTLHLEGGGRSIGAEILVRGNSLDSARETLEFGGTQLLNLVNDLYVAKHGGRQLRRSQLENAIRTGYLRDGNSVVPIWDVITAAKKEIARQIVTEVRQKVFDQQRRVAVTDLNVVSVSGRLFDGTPVEKGSVSVADFLKEEFKALSPETQFVRIEGNYIPQGLLLRGLIEFFGDQLEAAASAEGSDTYSQE
jgi:hypothetical protein